MKYGMNNGKFDAHVSIPIHIHLMYALSVIQNYWDGWDVKYEHFMNTYDI